ncbi:hypothetical protein TNCV_2243401 [Trichonephila clavipes]|nr:hypothetical protein TNCV_2243401 [Trichonephila clavipes]
MLKCPPVGVVEKLGEGYQLRCRPRHLTMVQNNEVAANGSRAVANIAVMTLIANFCKILKSLSEPLIIAMGFIDLH